MTLLYKEHGVPVKKILKNYPKYSRSRANRDCKQSLTDGADEKKKHNTGKPPILTQSYRGALIRELDTLQKTKISFTAKQLQVMAGF